MGRTRLVVVGVVVAGVLAVAACSGAQEHSASNAGSLKGNAAGLAEPSSAGAAAVPQAAAGSGGGSGGGSVDTAAKDGGSTSGSGEGLLDSRSLIRTADITVRVKNISAADQVRVIAASVHGDVASDDRALGENATASLTIEVPPSSLASVLSRISALGTERGRTMSTQDVTSEVADVNSRVKSAEGSIDQLRLLFHRATKLGDIIALESELTRREANLESLQAQQRTLSAQTAMARVTANLTTVGPATAPARHAEHKGVGGALWRGWHNFAGAVAATTRGLALVGPFLAVVLLVAAGVLAGVRRHRRSLPAPAPDAAS